ncbi:hypothetical protein [Caulobacter sp. CCUG 60055]|uniref:hypothetical protein n=1 Tax=Caulobacter sp. CCUG 60055 TaxID=2100090 RepID=UPI001FA807DA|nr:hypothetical protein [Caulobacter sp. CCUG 60055]
MADLEFETRLDRLFAEPPHFPDAPLFALKVDERLNRGWTLRRLVIGALGLVGGVIGVAQIMSSGVLGKLQFVSNASAKSLNDLAALAPAKLSLPALPFGGEALWMSALLAILALGFALTRAIKEI